MELIFDCHNYLEDKKIKLIIIGFIDYAIVWWDQFVLSHKRNRRRLIETLKEMKTIMRRCFIHSHYYRELYQKLQCLSQGTKSGDEYHKEMEITIIQANVVKDREATLTKFLNGLNCEISNIVEL
jgi:hypothetical protein